MLISLRKCVDDDDDDVKFVLRMGNWIGIAW
jgi:hypothetical protein